LISVEGSYEPYHKKEKELNDLWLRNELIKISNININGACP